MGCRNSKPDPQPRQDIDLFAPEPDAADGDAKGDGDNSTEVDQFSLSDEFAFAKLNKHVFQVGTDCIVSDDTGTICGRISNVHPYENCFGLKFLYVVIMTIKSNGITFYRAEHHVNVPEYEGTKKLSELPIRPVLQEEKAKLRERGRVFAKHGLGAHYMMYKEKMFIRGSLGTCEVSAEGRVMVDTESFLHFNPNYSPLQNARRYGREDEDNLHFHQQQSRGSKTTSKEIPDSSLHLCWPTLCGFSLKTKRWGEIAVGALTDIEFSDDAFGQLVLDSDTKTMVQSLVENVHKEKQFTDIIQGKGGGCIFLLQGPPGVGKTLTAEAVSETLHRPLYCIDVGELGITPEVLETTLNKILEVAERWNAVVLIDECDIFLASRNQSDVLRNAMVGIFLRLLEYFSGVLFLTSNRFEEIDEAFKSRISVSIEYSDLNEASRKKVWLNLLDAAGASDTKVDVDKLAASELNGRQIKTAIRLAMSLACAAGQSFNQEHLEQTLRFVNTECAQSAK